MAKKSQEKSKQTTERKKDAKRSTRTYSLANREARKQYNLLEYEDTIKDAVHKVIPDVKVTVTEDSYTVYGIASTDAILIGKSLSATFRDAAMYKRVIFVSTPGEAFEEENLFYPVCSP
jgi:hypothetical protein